jgi:uncharacterized protein (TIGR00369 family)
MPSSGLAPARCARPDRRCCPGAPARAPAPRRPGSCAGCTGSGWSAGSVGGGVAVLGHAPIVGSAHEDFSYDGFDKHIGLEILSATQDEAVGRFEVTPQLRQPFGLLHGGVLCSVVETLGSVAGGAWFGERGNVVGTSNHTNLLRGVREGVLTGTATPIHRGRTQQLWSVDVRDEQQRLVAQGQLRVANLAGE